MQINIEKTVILIKELLSQRPNGTNRLRLCYDIVSLLLRFESSLIAQ